MNIRWKQDGGRNWKEKKGKNANQYIVISLKKIHFLQFFLNTKSWRQNKDKGYLKNDIILITILKKKFSFPINNEGRIYFIFFRPTLKIEHRKKSFLTKLISIFIRGKMETFVSFELGLIC